jgi:hypothetical protein
MPYHGNMVGSDIQSHMVSDHTRKCESMQRLSFQSVGLLGFHLHGMSHKITDGFYTCRAERLRVQQRELLSVPSIWWIGGLMILRMGSSTHGIIRDRGQCLRFCMHMRRIGGHRRVLSVLILSLSLAAGLCSAQEKLERAYGVKYVSADAVYLDGGSTAGLAEGQRLLIKRKGTEQTVIAQIEIVSVTPSSTVGRILSGSGDIKPGDVASLSPEEVEKEKISSKDARKYPQIISFTQDDPLDEEIRENLPKPPSPEVNRVRGRIGYDFGYMQQSEKSASLLNGITLRMDASRLGGTYWNLRGYYRGYRHSQGGNSGTPTLIDLVNRTYHLSLSYDNPNSHWIAGVGRLLVPWASSLDTLDGFYLGRRFGKATAGIFLGSAPDPTSWNYDPHRQTGGGFVNFEGGSYDKWRFTSTAGVALTRVNWHPDRQFGFFQNGIFYKRYFSVYSDMQIDMLGGSHSALDPSSTTPGAAQKTAQRNLELSRSYLTVRFQPLRVLSFDFSENYFRNIPTFDERLLSTGLLDKYLFQGLSGGFRLELPYKLGVYSTIGRSHRSGDAKPSWDYLAGVTATDILHTGVRADVKYSRFDSSFGRGTYRSLMLSRDIGERLQFDVQIGQQNTISSLSSQSRARFLNGNLNYFWGTHYYVGMGITVYRGGVENYRQSFITLGYRFDNRGRHEPR